MKYILKIAFILVVSTLVSFAQDPKPAFSFCGKTGECKMTWDEFMACKKELESIDKNVAISSFILTIEKAEKKDYVLLEFPAKGNKITKQAMDMIEKLHKDKKLGSKLEIDTVEVVQSGKAAKRVPGMVIILN